MDPSKKRGALQVAVLLPPALDVYALRNASLSAEFLAILEHLIRPEDGQAREEIESLSAGSAK